MRCHIVAAFITQPHIMYKIHTYLSDSSSSERSDWKPRPRDFGSGKAELIIAAE